MNMIKKLAELYVQGEFNTLADTPEVTAASKKLDQYITENVPMGTAPMLNTLAADYATRNLEQGFLQGFLCARALLLGDGLEG